MTGNAIRFRKNELMAISKKRKLSAKELKEHKELSCRDMVNSILIYHFAPKQTEVLNNITGEVIPVSEMILKDRYMDDYARNKKVNFLYIGEKRVKEIISEQMDDYSKAEVNIGCYTDHEGCTYNSCRWADEL